MKKSLKSAALPGVQAKLHEIGQAIRARRLARQWTIEHLSLKAGNSAATVKRIERGDPAVSMGHWAACMDALDTLQGVADAAMVVNDAATQALQKSQLRVRGLRKDRKRHDF